MLLSEIVGLNTRIFSEMCRWEGGEIPKGRRAGRARSLGNWPGGRDHGGGAESQGHLVSVSRTFKHWPFLSS